LFVCLIGEIEEHKAQTEQQPQQTHTQPTQEKQQTQTHVQQTQTQLQNSPMKQSRIVSHAQTNLLDQKKIMEASEV